MSIEFLQTKRRKSVQDQNAILKRKIRECALGWLSGEALPEPIESYFLEKGVNRDNCLLIDYYRGHAQSQMAHSGILITNDGKFIEFEIDLNVQETAIENIEVFGPVKVECSGHLRGTGKSFGYLSKEVLSEIRN